MNSLKENIIVVFVQVFLIFLGCYMALRVYDKNSYCLSMPMQDLDFMRDGAKTFGDQND